MLEIHSYSVLKYHIFFYRDQICIFFGKLRVWFVFLHRRWETTIRLWKWWCSEISVTVIKLLVPSMTSQRCSESRSMVSTMAWQMAWGVHVSLFPDYMCQEEGVPFSYYYKCSKKLAEFWGPQRESRVRVQAERRVWQEESKWSTWDGEATDNKFPEEPAVATVLHNSWLGKKAILVVL